MADRKISFKIEALGTDKLSNDIVALEKELLRLADRRKQLRKEAKEGKISEDQLARSLATIKTETAQVSKEQAKLKKQFNDGVKAANGLDGSYDQLTAETRELKAQLRALPNAFDETNEEANKLKQQIAANTEQLKAFDKELGDNFRNVGNYTDSMKEAFESTSLMSGQLQTVTNVFNVTKNVFKQVNNAIDNSVNSFTKVNAAVDNSTKNFNDITNNVDKSVKSFTEVNAEIDQSTQNFSQFNQANVQVNQNMAATGGALKKNIGILKAFRIALVSTGIGAIVVALGSLFTYFTKTKKGAEVLTKATNVLSSSFNVIVGRVASLGELIFNAFENPKESLISFGEAIVDNILNRFKAIINTGGILADVMGNLFEGDFASAKDRVGDLGQAFIQFQTGLDVDQQNAIADSFKNIATDIGNAAEEGLKLASLEINIKNLRRETQLSNAALENQKELLQATADDTTLSFKQREEAAEQFRVKAEELSAQQLELANLERELADRRLKEAEENGLVTDELLDQQVEARLKVVEAENQLTLTVRQNERQRSELTQDRLERDLDFLLDNFDNIKTINDKIAADSKRSFEERQKALDETAALGEKSFNDQIAVIQKLTDVQVNGNELVAESDSKLLAEKVRNLGLSEIIEGRLLEIVRDRRTAEAEQLEEQTNINRDIDLANREAELELKQLRLEEDLAFDDLSFEQQLAKKIERLTIERDEELKQLNLTEKQKEAIIKKYELDKRKLEEKNRKDKIAAEHQLASAQIDIASNLVSSLGTLAKEGSAVAKAAFVLEKGLALAQVAINLQKELALINANPVVNADLTQATRTALITGAIARGVGIVASIKAAKFARGGLTEGGMFEGNSHANGGIKFAAGGRIMEAEGGEAIINKKSTAMFKPILSAINSFGGNGKKFADGGLVPAGFNANSLISGNVNVTNDLSGVESQISAIKDAFKDIKVKNVVSETNDAIISIDNIQSEATL